MKYRTNPKEKYLAAIHSQRNMSCRSVYTVHERKGETETKGIVDRRLLLESPSSFDEFPFRRLGHLRAREEPDEEDDHSEHCRPDEVACSELPAAVLEKIRNLSKLEAGDILNIAFPDFWLGEILVFLEDMAQIPARDFSNHCYHTSSSMLERR